MKLLALVFLMLAGHPALAQNLDAESRWHWIQVGMRDSSQFAKLKAATEAGDKKAREEIFAVLKKEIAPRANEPSRLATQFNAMILLYDDLTLEQVIPHIKAKLAANSIWAYISDSQELKLFNEYLSSEAYRFNFSSAGTCADFQLDGPGQPFSEIPVRNQNPYGNCYAHASINALDAFRFQHAPEKFKEEGLSSVHWANYMYEIIAENKQDKEHIDFDGGYELELLEMLRAKKVCPGWIDKLALEKLEEMYARNKPRFATLQNILTAMNIGRAYTLFSKTEVDAALAKGGHEYKRLLASKMFTSDTAETRLAEKKMMQAMLDEMGANEIENFRHFLMSYAPESFKGMKGAQVLALPFTAENFFTAVLEVSELKNNTRANVLAQNRFTFMKGFEQLCGDEKLKIPYGDTKMFLGGMTVPPFKVQSAFAYKDWWQGKALSLGSVDKVLRKSQTPLTIALCASPALQKNYASSSYHAYELSERHALMRNNCGAHAVVLIGQKYSKVTKSCQYLIRNSWGKNARYGYPTTERGDVWLPQQVMTNDVFRATYLTPAGWL